jgi:hypothetical protein
MRAFINHQKLRDARYFKTVGTRLAVQCAPRELWVTKAFVDIASTDTPNEV